MAHGHVVVFGVSLPLASLGGWDLPEEPIPLVGLPLCTRVVLHHAPRAPEENRRLFVSGDTGLSLHALSAGRAEATPTQIGDVQKVMTADVLNGQNPRPKFH